MKSYELLLILSGSVKEADVPAAIADVKKLFDKHGAKVEQESVWGNIKLAYQIKHQTHGTYVLWRLSIEPTSANKLTTELEVAENVIRFLLTDKPKNKQPIELPNLADERREAREAKNAGAKPAGVDKSKPAAEGESKPSGEGKKSLDEILEEKI